MEIKNFRKTIQSIIQNRNRFNLSDENIVELNELLKYLESEKKKEKGIEIFLNILKLIPALKEFIDKFYT